jgi:hypothetical protein
VVDRPVAALVTVLEAAGFDVLARHAVKKTPSRAVHWVRTGRLPRILWRVGTWFDRMSARWNLEHADYVEALFVARKRGGLESPDLPTARDMAVSMFVPPIWMRRRPGGKRPGD